MENQNDQRLSALAGKLSSIREVTNDIYTHASDQGMLDSATNSFSQMLGSIKSSGSRLARAAQSGHPVIKTVGLAISIIFIVYLLVHFFW